MKASLEKQSKLTHSNFYPLVADLLSYLSIKCESDSKTVEEVEEQKLPQQFSHMLKWFWEGLSFLCFENLKSPGNEVGDNCFTFFSIISVMLQGIEQTTFLEL